MEFTCRFWVELGCLSFILPILRSFYELCKQNILLIFLEMILLASFSVFGVVEIRFCNDHKQLVGCHIVNRFFFSSSILETLKEKEKAY